MVFYRRNPNMDSQRTLLSQLLHEVFSSSKEYLAAADTGVSDTDVQTVVAQKRLIYTAFVQHDDGAVLVKLEELLRLLENIELAGLQSKKENLQSHMQERMQNALSALQNNTDSTALDFSDLDISSQNDAAQILPYELRRKQIERLQLMHSPGKYRILHAAFFMELTVIWLSIIVMGLYISELIAVGPIMWYSMMM